MTYDKSVFATEAVPNTGAAMIKPEQEAGNQHAN